MSTNTRRDFRRLAFAGLIGLVIGIGLSGVIAYILVGPAALPAAEGLKTAGRLPPAAVHDPDAAKRDEQARRTADAVIDGLVKKDTVALASLCGSPFLWARLDSQRDNRRPGRNQALLFRRAVAGFGSRRCTRPTDLDPPVRPVRLPRSIRRSLRRLTSGEGAARRVAAQRVRPDDRGRGEGDADRGPRDSGRPSRDRRRAWQFQPPPFRLTRDVIYGRKFGTALTLDLVQPKKAGNRAAVIELTSDTFTSGRQTISDSLFARYQGLIDLGYTVVFVAHSSTPRYPIPEIVGDIRAGRVCPVPRVRLDLDPDRIAVMGGAPGATWRS